MNRHFAILLALLSLSVEGWAQEFFNLTAQEVRIDSVLPLFTHQYDLGSHYADSVYEVSIDYPEFIDMSATDVARYEQISGQPLPELPVVEQYVAVERRQGRLGVSFVPLVFRDGRYQKLVSFKLSLRASLPSHSRNSSGPRNTGLPSGSSRGGRYAAHSVLASGNWAKIRVPSTGVYQLTDALCRQAGFTSPSKVKVFGYGGALQPENLTGDYLTETDDLKEVPTCTVGGRRLFHAVGPVSWESATTRVRTRNYCSDYGYYFLTETDDEPLVQDSAAFLASFYPAADDYHSLAERDGYAWYHSGRNLYDATPLNTTRAVTYELQSSGTGGTLSVCMSYDGYCTARVTLNDSLIGTIEVSPTTTARDVSYFGSETTYSSAAVHTWHFNVGGALREGSNTVGLLQTSGQATMRTDHLTLTQTTPRPAPSLTSASLPVPEYVYRITNQDHHADAQTDMVIIIPTSQLLLEQAQRLKAFHEQHDSLRVTIVPADELFNEFSSGTPDVSAYRRYLKMLYDRAETDDDMPRYLLLFGDGSWDNRMLQSQWQAYSPDDFLLCYESENSFSETYSFVSEDYFAMLDDGENTTSFTGMPDVGVGRISARTAAEAKIVVDKVIAYASNEQAGSWQNTVCIMGDDGNQNKHMQDAETIATVVSEADDSYYIKKVYWDAYTRVSSATGNSYPEVERLLRQQMKDGALIMNYSGHGAAYCLSHEQVLKLADFRDISAQGRLPLWVTASCDIAPFDTQEENIGETAMFNPTGGAIAFLGTARTVFMTQNRQLNRAFTKHVLASVNGRQNSIGDAMRLAKNELVTGRGDLGQNKLHYVLLGDPALRLSTPSGRVVIDSVGGMAVGQGTAQLSAGTVTTIVGHVEGQPQFSGTITAMVLDIEETIVCKLNAPDESAYSETNFEFRTRPSIIYTGSDSIDGGRFALTFAVPKDISYSDAPGQIIIYAVTGDRQQLAHGQTTGLAMGDSGQLADDGVGPSIYCYLNSPSFQNGGTVNSTPYFYATLTDKDGINAAGSGIGHDMELIIDGELQLTYNLNSYFQYDFGDYRSGTVSYSIPELGDGPHKLLFRAWDVLNNSSTAELQFTVDSSQQPSLVDVVCMKNPASTSTRFVVSHDRAGSQVDVVLEVFDTSGRVLWRKSETGVPADQTYTIDWDLTTSGGSRLRTGVYLYRASVSSGGSSQATAARKLVVLGNN